MNDLSSQFSTESQKIRDLFLNSQNSFKVLHSVCGHAKIHKQTKVTALVPGLRNT